MNPQLSRKEEIEKGCGKQISFKPSKSSFAIGTCGYKDKLGVNYICKDCQARLDERIRAEQDFLKTFENIKKRIMINGNLSNRIISLGDEEFEFKHDYILNNIVCEIIDEEVKSTIKETKE